MTTYYKATRCDGTDFYSGTVDYAAALANGTRVRVGTPTQRSYHCCTEHVLHASDVPTETLVGGRWPCRLFEVTGRPVAQKNHKFGFRSLRVLREVDAWQALGPQGREVAALMGRAGRLTQDEAWQLSAARAAARDAASAAAWAAASAAAWAAARVAAWDAAWAAAWAAASAAASAAAWAAARVAAWDAAWAAARALIVRDLIGQSPGWDQGAYDRLTGPWRRAVGPIHPDDAAVAS